MVTFGFSAFVKLLSLNDRPQATELRKRLAPSTGDGYDFHKQMRQLVRRYVLSGESLETLLTKAAGFSNAAEGRSAITALRCIEAWLHSASGRVVDFGSAVYESPGRVFRVKVEPTFGLYLSGRAMPIEVWNTMKPPLAEGPTYAALSVAAEAYERQGIDLENVGLLSLQNPVRLYLLTDVPRQTRLAASLVDRIEEALRAPPAPRPQPDDRPFA